jgi:hypothetical protein
MLDKDRIFHLLTPVKGWPAREAQNLEDAARMILGSPYWLIPEDTYKIIDKNETYSLLAVYKDGRISWNNRYLALNMKLMEQVEWVSEEPPG